MRVSCIHIWSGHCGVISGWNKLQILYPKVAVGWIEKIQVLYPWIAVGTDRKSFKSYNSEPQWDGLKMVQALCPWGTVERTLKLVGQIGWAKMFSGFLPKASRVGRQWTTLMLEPWWATSGDILIIKKDHPQNIFYSYICHSVKSSWFVHIIAS